jgi:hypothetical protein
MTAETNRAQTAESSLSLSVATEQTRAETVEQSNANAVASEVTRAESAESGLTGQITTEVNRAETVEQTLAEAITAEVTRAQSAESNKVDKVVGQGLSTNDFTTAEKEKLAGLGSSELPCKDLVFADISPDIDNVSGYLIGYDNDFKHGRGVIRFEKIINGYTTSRLFKLSNHSFGQQTIPWAAQRLSNDHTVCGDIMFEGSVSAPVSVFLSISLGSMTLANYWWVLRFDF